MYNLFVICCRCIAVICLAGVQVFCFLLQGYSCFVLWCRGTAVFYLLQVYSWTGENNFIVRGGLGSLVVGSSEGHFGLWLDENFNMGRSMPVSTFR